MISAIDRKNPPRIKDAVDFTLELKPYRLFHLDNGVPVYAVHAGTEEVMQLEWVFDAGAWYEDATGVAAAANHLLKNGTAARSAYEINEHFDYYGAYLNRNCYSETSSVVLHCLTRHLGQLLPVVRELITDSVFPEQELDIYRQNAKQQLSVNLKKCEFVANRLIDEYLFGYAHPYGRYNTTETYDALETASIRRYHERFYGQGRCRIFVAGILPPDLQERLNAVFGGLSWNRIPPPEVKHEPAPAAERRHRIINDAEGVQGAIRLARPFPNRHHPDHKRAVVLNTLFGGFFGSRLMGNIREDKGYTYGIHSYLQNLVSEGAWMVSTEAGRDVCEAAVQEVYREMRILREEPVPEEELMMVKNYLMGTLLGDLDGPFHIIGRWKNLILNGLDERYFYESIEAIRATTPEQLMELAGRYLREEDFYELVVV